MSYLRGTYGVSWWDGEGKEHVSETFSMGATASEVNCRMIEWVKWGTLKWFGCLIRMNEDFVKSMRARWSAIRERTPKNGSIEWIRLVL